MTPRRLRFRAAPNNASAANAPHALDEASLPGAAAQPPVFPPVLAFEDDATCGLQIFVPAALSFEQSKPSGQASVEQSCVHAPLCVFGST